MSDTERPWHLRGKALLAIGLVALVTAACSSNPPTSTSAPTSTSTTVSVPPQPSDVVWLCRPGVTPDPCTDPLTATSVNGGGAKRTIEAKPSATPKIDCFYVYPTVSDEPPPNANLTIQPQEVGAAIAQVSQFSQVCRVFAPMYPQATLSDIGSSPADSEELTAYNGLVQAWNYYINYLNDGRGFVIIGHSQGAEVATNLIQKLIDPNAALRKRLVSAIILGGNLLVKSGQRTGGFFQHIPTCDRASETGCVIAYSTFYQEPPSDSRFGRAEQGPGAVIAQEPPPGTPVQVACVNPAELLGQSTLDSYFPTTSSPAESTLQWWPQVNEPTTWVTFPGLYSGQCMNTGGAQWLQITVHQGSVPRPTVQESLGPTWGLHLSDPNLLMGDLVDVVKQQAAAYRG